MMCLCIIGTVPLASVNTTAAGSTVKYDSESSDQRAKSSKRCREQSGVFAPTFILRGSFIVQYKDINNGEEITYDYGGHDLPWRSRYGQKTCEFVHEPVAPALTGSEVTSPKEFVHEPVTPALTRSEVTSPEEFVHEPVTTALTGSEVTSPEEFVHEPVTPALTRSEVTSPEEVC
ncbi:hypothetical protein F2P79_005496 [Pimephales promelas]|nr:hypothetical protein F2P79_005496 [Pimephales promelas]